MGLDEYTFMNNLLFYGWEQKCMNQHPYVKNNINWQWLWTYAVGIVEN